MSGMSLLFIGFMFVIIFAAVFFGIISKHSEQGSARVDRLIELNELSERKKMEKFMYDNDFYQVFQPFIDSKTEQIVGFEALTRLDGEDESDTMPVNFLKKIKEQNLFEKFDMFVFKKYCDWIKNDESGMVVTCNFSQETLAADGTADRIIKLADDVGISHNKAAIEIIAGALKGDDGGIRRNLGVLKDSGFRIYIDDFEKTEMSCDELRTFRPDVVKLGRELFENIHTKEERLCFKNMIEIVKAADAKALCEGVESGEQADTVKELGCDLIQGYYFYKPMHAESSKDLL